MRCPKCGSKLVPEEELPQYPLLCKECDENFFTFEAVKDYSKETGNVSYADCRACVHTFGDKSCTDCNYYQDCMTQKEIDELELAHDRALARFYDRLENEEYPL